MKPHTHKQATEAATHGHVETVVKEPETMTQTHSDHTTAHVEHVEHSTPTATETTPAPTATTEATATATTPTKAPEPKPVYAPAAKDGAKVMLTNGMPRVDYIKKRYAEGASRSTITKEINELRTPGSAPIPYQIVFAATKPKPKAQPAAVEGTAAATTTTTTATVEDAPTPTASEPEPTPIAEAA